MDAEQWEDAIAASLEGSVSALQMEGEGPAQARLLSMPTEIISQIFIHFLPVYPLCPPLTGPLSPLLLTHICHNLREIALGTPVLWRAITLTFNEVPFARQTHMINLWLDRSHVCPLSIRLEDNDYSAPLAEVIAPIVLHCTRWEYLWLRVSAWDDFILDRPMPLIRHLHLSLVDPVAPDIITFREVPLLRSVILDQYAASMVDLPWTQLASLTLREVFRSEYPRILRQASNLRHCQLHIIYLYDDFTDPGEFMLPSLESLVLYDANNDWGGMTAYPADVFIVPALRRLQIPESFLGREPINGLTSFISMAGCGSVLQEVCIISNGGPFNESQYWRAFPSIPKFSSIDVRSQSENGFGKGNSQS